MINTTRTSLILGIVGCLAFVTACGDQADTPIADPAVAQADDDQTSSSSSSSSGAATSGSGAGDASSGSGGDATSGSGGGDTSTGAGGSADPGDTEAPTLLSTLPAYDAKGVTSDAELVFTFSEPMDQASVEANYVSLSLPAQDVKFSWSDAGDELTVTPLDEMSYAAGNASVVAYTYGAKISAGATDLAGNPMADDAEMQFDTLRAISAPAIPLAPNNGTVTSFGGTSEGVFQIGDSIGNVPHRTVLTFSLTFVPDDAVALYSATLSANENGYAGAPDGLHGQMSAYQVFYDALDQYSYSAEPFAAVPVQRLVGLNIMDPTVRRADVTALVAEDLANREVRNDLTRVRLAFATATTVNGIQDMVTLSYPQLDLVYLAE
jgi:hypothetical protein